MTGITATGIKQFCGNCLSIQILDLYRKDSHTTARSAGLSESMIFFVIHLELVLSRLTKNAEPRPSPNVNNDSGTDIDHGGWLQRWVERSRFAGLTVERSVG